MKTGGWPSRAARQWRSAAGAAALLAASIRFKQPILRNLAVISGVGWLALVASLFIEAQSGEGTEAVVTAEEVVARAADSALLVLSLLVCLPHNYLE